MYSHLVCSSLASRHLHSTLHLLLLHFGTYFPPVASLSAASTATSLGPGERVDEEILARKGVLERVLSSGCFVGPLRQPADEPEDDEMLGDDPDESFGPGNEMDVDQPTSASSTSSKQKNTPLPPLPPHLGALKRRHARSSTTRPLRVPVPSLAGEGLGNGTLLVPGWIRERVAESLFDFQRAGQDRDDDRVEEQSVVEVVLSALSKVSD